ncbi:glycosyltransferase [Ekhidna sp.]|uniref:glycosyltransferase family 2 protein n=1 Tax=Ekhidna sp. TaxID=2608089 RepID=UPI003299142D
MSEVKKNITVVILTYGGRKYIYQVLEYLKSKKQIRDIVIVSNGLVFSPPNYIEEYCHVINNKNNIGSSAGYLLGLDKAKKLNNEFTWLLDDDNLPDEDALDELLKVWEKNRFTEAANPVALQCYRTSQFAFKKFHDNVELDLLPYRDSFMCFHFRKLPRMIFNRLNPSLFAKRMNPTLQHANAAFYGGLFVETKTLLKIPAPNTNYFMYVDDLEFTNNIKKCGGAIFIASNCVINDLDFSLDLEMKRKILYHPLLDFSTNMKAFHYSRNIYHFTKSHLITNHFVYKINKAIFFCIIKTFSIIRSKNYRFKVFLSGIRSGAKLYNQSNV